VNHDAHHANAWPLYTSLRSSVIRRDHAPAIPYFSGSGFPIPDVGARSASSVSRLIRFLQRVYEWAVLGSNQ
jgi:hypothetical protein